MSLFEREDDILFYVFVLFLTVEHVYVDKFHFVCGNVVLETLPPLFCLDDRSHQPSDKWM